MKDITLNFGAIQETVNRLIASSILNESKNNILNSFTKKIKSNPVLLKQYYIFENFKNCKPFENKTRLAERFINQNLNIIKEHNWKEIKNANRELRISLLENTHVEATKGENTELFNNIQNLIESTTTPGYLNVNKSELSYDYLLNFLTRKPLSESAKSKEIKDNPNINWRYVTKLAVNNFEERFEHLKESEKKIFSMLISEDSSKKENFINDIKDENINLITTLLESEIKKGNNENVALLETFKNKMMNGKNDNISQNDIIIAYNELNEQLKEF